MTENINESDIDKVSNTDILQYTSQIVSAYVSYNSVSGEELPNVMANVYDTLAKTARISAEGVGAHLSPAVPVKQSVNDDYIICLEDGKKFKSLKRHLRTYYGLTPEEYRKKWGLPSDYPMVAPNYAKRRSVLARESGLGRKRGATIKRRSR